MLRHGGCNIELIHESRYLTLCWQQTPSVLEIDDIEIIFLVIFLEIRQTNGPNTRVGWVVNSQYRVY